MLKDWQMKLPILTPDRVQEIRNRDRAIWFSRLPEAQEPRLGFHDARQQATVIAQLRNASDPQTVRRLSDLRRVIDEILYEHWLRVGDHHADRLTRNRTLLGFPLPTYRTPDELTGGSLTHQAAVEELWQRDIGDALPALSLGAHLFPDIADICRERMKQLILTALDFPTWGAKEPYVNMDLSVAHLARGIAVAYDWHRPFWTDDERRNLFRVLEQKLATLLKGAYGAAFWSRGWTDNHCQNAFAALGICGVCFLGEIPEAEEWLGAAVAGFEYALPLCNADGSSAEGVPYWSYGVSFLLQYIELTRHLSGADSLYESPYLRNAVSYRLNCSLPDLSGTVTFGDAHRQDYYGPSHILYALARQYRDGAAQWFGDAIPFPNRGGADIEAWTLLWRDPSLQPSPPASLPLDHHLPSWDVATTRNGWKPNDYVVAVKSGYTNRNHSHLDVGAILWGWGDEWIIDAPGYGAVGPGFWDTKKTRWDYYSNSTESHSTLLINGRNQRFDAHARATITAFLSRPDTCQIDIDLTQAYTDVLEVRRRVFHRRGQYILVLDEVTFAAGAENRVEWLLQPGRNVAVQNPADTANADILLRGKAGTVRVRPVASFGSTGFVPRRPTAPHRDVPDAEIRTFSLVSQGEPSTAFAVLLVPGDEMPVNTSVELWKAGDRRVVVTGAGFNDKIGG